jgi:hypothetical protein
MNLKGRAYRLNISTPEHILFDPASVRESQHIVPPAADAVGQAVQFDVAVCVEVSLRCSRCSVWVRFAGSPATQRSFRYEKAREWSPGCS